MLDTGSTISTTQATSHDNAHKFHCKVLYSATANEIQMCGEKVVLDINYGSNHNYLWCFTKTDLRFFVIGIDLLTVLKLIVDSYDHCLINKICKYVIPLFPVHSVLPKICCILQEKKHVTEF